jgi:hypothetical protein
MCITKYITATKTEVNVCNIQVRSICQIMSYVTFPTTSVSYWFISRMNLHQPIGTHQSVDCTVQGLDFFSFTFSYYCNGQQFSCFTNQIWFLLKEETNIFH